MMNFIMTKISLLPDDQKQVLLTKLAKDRILYVHEPEPWIEITVKDIMLTSILKSCTNLIMEHYVERNVNGIGTEELIKELLTY